MSCIDADLTAEATDYILERYTNRPMEEPTEQHFQAMLLEFETKKRKFLDADEVRVVKVNLRWVWNNITPGMCPPDDIRVEMDDSATGWKKQEEEVKSQVGEQDGGDAYFIGTHRTLEDVKERHPFPEDNYVCYLSDVPGNNGEIYIAIVENGQWVQVLFSPDLNTPGGN